MKENYIQKLMDEKVNINKLSDEERKLKLKNIYVQTPDIREIIEEIEECRVDAKYKKNPLGLVLLGDAGSGKTSLITQYVTDYNLERYDIEKDDRTQTIVPVLIASVPPSVTGPSILTALLDAIGDPGAYLEHTAQIKMRRLLKFLKDCQVEMIVLDEVQHIHDRDGGKVSLKAFDWIKSVLDEAMIPIVLCGLNRIEDTIYGESQMRGRFRAKKELWPFSINSLEKTKEFRQFLHLIDLKLPLPELSGLEQDKFMHPLYEASEGSIRTLMESIIIPATLKAIDQRAKKLNIGLIKLQIERLGKIEEIEIIKERLAKSRKRKGRQKRSI